MYHRNAVEWKVQYVPMKSFWIRSIKFKKKKEKKRKKRGNIQAMYKYLRIVLTII